MPEEHYLGNPLLKKANTRVDLNAEQLEELIRCSLDPIYFAKNYMKIVTLDHGLQPFAMFPFQERMMRSFQNNRFNIAMLSRQSGKCFHLNTIVRVKNKNTGEIIETTIGEFYDRIKE